MSLNAETTIKPREGVFDRMSPSLDGAKGAIGRATGNVRGFAKRRPWLAGGLAVLLLGAVGYGVYSVSTSDTPKYIVAPVVKGNIEDSVTALGNLQPRDYVDVGAQVSGQLKKLYVDIGDTVKQGQLLADIDPLVLTAKVQQDQASVANLRAQLADRQAQAALAAANYKRQQGLMAANATAKADYDAAKQLASSTAAQITALKAQVAGAQSLVNGDNIQLGYTKIYAPMSGTIASITTKQGQTIIASQQAPVLLRIADLTTMTVWTQVSEADVPKLHVGMDAYFTTLGDTKRYTGKLTQIQPTPTTVNNVVLYTATFDVKNPENKLMTQMTAQVFFVTKSARDVVTVPVSALHQGRGHKGGRTRSASPSGQQGSAANSSGGEGERAGGGFFNRGEMTDAMRERFQAIRAAMKTPGAKRYSVLVMKADGTTERRPVVVGVSNRVTAQVLAGLDVGEQVVVGEESATPAAASGSSRNGSGSNRNGRNGLGGGPMGPGGFGPR
ncbi:MAG TPA: efflux RND transporter periplasmic adaptor subunit [Rhizomicrobium sp.]|jgi:macrolide-specific efflux system membrane fusion protein|nr:efflux RND transporter periplasmic adaptor subunit [Rhizomicrobium sp.]